MSNLHSAVVAAAQAAVAAELAAPDAPNLAQGTYTNAKVVVNNQGQVTSIESTPQPATTAAVPHNVTASRTPGTVYLNNTGRMITLNVSMSWGSTGTLYVQVGSNAAVMAGTAKVAQFSSAFAQASLCATVPPGLSYNSQVDVGGATIEIWTETY
jgi:hypothetical protein